MKRRIWLATGLLLLAALGVLAFQGYWTYQTYRQASWRLRQDSQAALVAATQQAGAAQNERLLTQYARWLQDTTHVRLSCRVSPRYGATEFLITGVPARRDDQTTLSFEDFKPRLAHLTPAAQTYFIKRFVGSTVRDELARGYVYFHTQWLGRQLSTAIQRSRTTPAEFRRLLAAELRRRGLPALPFRLRLRTLADLTRCARPRPAIRWR